LYDYLNEAESTYNWTYTGDNFLTLKLSRAYKLNVSSLTWLDESVYTIPGGSPNWTHEVFVVVPANLKYKNVSTFWISTLPAGCNNDAPRTSLTADVEVADLIASDTRSIVVIGYQIPNCPMIFADDPTKEHRTEDP
jgi:PhoPQ-activated pathogenicity-related protein